MITKWTATLCSPPCDGNKMKERWAHNVVLASVGSKQRQHVNVNKCAVVEGRAVWIVDSIERDVAKGWPDYGGNCSLSNSLPPSGQPIATVWLPIFRAKTFSKLISPAYRSACGELSVKHAFNIRTNAEDGEEQLLEGMLPQQFAPPETFSWLFFEALVRSEDTRWRRSMLKAVFATTKFRAVAWFLSELL